MADASQETIQRLIGNSEKGLAQIEVSLSHILETRQAVLDAIKKPEEGSNVILELTLVLLDTLLAENMVIYDLSASFEALRKATNDYTKRFYKQSLNLCFVEACRLFAGEAGDEVGLLTKLEKLTKQLDQTGCQYIARHIINDIQKFRKDYCDSELRNITRHYDDPIKMYEKQQFLESIEFYEKGTSQLMAIRMEMTVLSSYLLNLLSPIRKDARKVVLSKRYSLDIKGMLNDAIFKAFKKKGLQKEIQRTLGKGQASLNECYMMHKQCLTACEFFEKRNCRTEKFRKMESLILLRMEVMFLRYDIACSIWGYLNSTTEMERSQNLRLIHITKQAALTHIYGYNEKIREKSLWAAIKGIEETSNEKLHMESVEKTLRKLTGNLADDNESSQMFAHYRYKQDFYIPDRLEAFNKMEHHKEFMDSIYLLNVCKVLDDYTFVVLYCIDKNQKQKRKKQHDEWMGLIDGLATKAGNDEEVKESLKPMRDLIEMVYGDKDLMTY